MECKTLHSPILFTKNSEDDLSEVLQVEEIFSNATQGEIASDNALQAVFGKISKMEMIKQVS